MHAGMRQWVRDLNAVYRAEQALWETDFSYEGFRWIDFHDAEQTVLSFMRRGKDSGDEVVVVCNFTPVPRVDYRVGVPREGRYRELLNSDAGVYGGGNLGNAGGVWTEPVADHGCPQSLRLVIPPLGLLVLKRDDG